MMRGSKATFLVLVALAVARTSLCDIQTVTVGALGCITADHTLVGNSEYEIVFEAVTLPGDGLLCSPSDLL